MIGKTLNPKIYTKTGDPGTSGLYGGKRISKTDARLEAYGTIDELNAWLGYALALITADHNPDGKLTTLLEQTQRQLFNIGAHLATPYTAETRPASLPQLAADSVTELEKSIDALDTELPELRAFILPGGSVAASVMHIGRTVCRRAERRVVALAKATYIDPLIVQYLNRLSDWLFIVARSLNHQHGVDDQLWK